MTDTLRDIPREITEVLNENWVPSRVVYGTDEPDGFSSVRGWAAHVAEVILAIPGIAVVELPEPAEAVRCWPALVGGEPESVYLAQGEVIVSGGLRVYVDEARNLAAALLAAADLAERDQ